MQVFAGQSRRRLFHIEQSERRRRVENASGEATLRAKLAVMALLRQGATSSVRLAKAELDESAQLGVAL